MANNKVKPSNAGKGRGKGNVNKTTAAIKDMIDQALRAAGGVDYLVKQSKENPTAFMGLVGKILPKDINLSAHLEIENLSDEELNKRLAEKLATAKIK